MARSTADWRYEGETSVYDLPAWDLMAAKGWGLTDPATRAAQFLALLESDGRTAGFLNFVDGGDSLTIGLGLRPDLCGRGLGARVMKMVDEEALRRRGPGLLRLEVRVFNERAIRCYERSGWLRVEVIERITPIGPGEFLVMERWVGERLGA